MCNDNVKYPVIVGEKLASHISPLLGEMKKTDVVLKVGNGLGKPKKWT